jgi:hypothetical protein
MLVGDPGVVALESSIQVALPRRGQIGIGYFLIHVAGREYGVRSPEATLLACSFDEIKRRIERRGHHTAPFAAGAAASLVAGAVRRALYFDVGPEERFLGLTREALAEAVHQSRLLWAPDGDEAFDDGSYVLQLDEGDEVRVIAFQSRGPEPYDPASLREVVVAGDVFYGVLTKWVTDFAAEWLRTPKSE